MIEKSLKKGKGGEVAAGAKLGILLGLQLSDPEVVYKELKSLLVQMLTDKTQTPASRAAIANTLSGRYSFIVLSVAFTDNLEIIAVRQLPKK